MDFESIKKSLEKRGQGHLFKFWDQLSSSDKQDLLEQISHIDVDEIMSSFHTSMKETENAQEKIDDKLQAVSPEVFGSFVECDKDILQSYEEKGLSEISKNGIAVLLLAGGQGTRLGVNYPKGMVNVGLPSNKTLFQLQAERILKVQQLAEQFTRQKGVIPWYIMTSEHTKDPTEKFFKENNYFGLNKEDISIFEQSRLPCFTMDGKFILESPSKLAAAPDGNGGLYRALCKHKIIDDMIARDIKYIHVYCVDNILVKLADPIFIGFCIDKGAKCGAKSVVKAFPTESVGVICKVDGIYQVVEYSEISRATAELTNANGNLVFNAGNICNHFFTLEFLKEVSSLEQEKTLKYHIAKKKIPFVDDNGQTCKPETPNGIKMEKFVFDVFKFCRPEESNFVCEISPLVSYAGEGLNDLINNRQLTSPIEIEMGPNGVTVKDGSK